MSGLNDTHPEIEALQIRLLREMPVWRKLELLTQLNQMAYKFAMAVVRQRHPAASEAQLKWRMAALLYGEELAEKAYGPAPQASGDSGV